MAGGATSTTWRMASIRLQLTGFRRDTALELKPYGVTALSLYPGQVSTEGMVAYTQANPAIDLNTIETPQFVGRCIAALAIDPAILNQTGEFLINAEVAQAYGIRDINGNQPKSQRTKLWEAAH
jgi:dehydrogenase/reductase SDR family member 1